MSSIASKSSYLGPFRPRSSGDLARFGVVAALLALILFGALRYDHFLSSYNALSFLRYNSMFALIALGMALVIMTGGIDLSVGGTAAMSSVVAALLSPYHGLWVSVAAWRLVSRLARSMASSSHA
jgi:ribose transport system permease protein